MNKIASARDFLQGLSSALRSLSLYPETHPIRFEKVDELHRAAQALLSELGRFDLFVHQDSFFLDDTLLRRESLTLQGMMRQWQEAGVVSISVEAGVTREDLEGLVEHLGTGTPLRDGAVKVNTAVLIKPEDRPLPASEDLLRRAYADALDLIRDLGAAVARGITPPLAPARQTVEGLVDAVLTDPESSILLTAMRSHDEGTFFHMINVSILSIATGATIGLSRPQLSTLGLGGLLHDLGKIAVPPETLRKTGPLSDVEWTEIRRHPAEGAAMILRSWDRLTPLAARIAYEHHLRIDGTGYPALAMAGGPDLLSRIVSVADTFDAVTSRRPYRRADHRERALEILLSGAGRHYDPRVVRVFIRMLGHYPPGSVVQLDDGSVAVVVRNNTDALGTPVVKVVRNPQGEMIEPIWIDLNSPESRGVSIVRGLPAEAAGVDATELI